MYLLVLFFLSFAIFFSYFIRSFCVFHVTNVFFWIRERKQGENKTPFAVSSIVFENINKPFIIFWSLLFIWDQNTIRCNKTKEKNQHLSKNSVNTRQTCPRTTEFLSFCFFIETRTPWKFRLIFRAEKIQVYLCRSICRRRPLKTDAVVPKTSKRSRVERYRSNCLTEFCHRKESTRWKFVASVQRIRKFDLVLHF